MKWKTKSGEVLNIYDMETNHIENCIAQLEKAVVAFKNELRYRKLGKPVGEEPFGEIIKSWEINKNIEEF